jgi:hypothetical protein
MRMITEHQINPANDKLAIAVLDEPGAGGANHHYRILGAPGSGINVDIHFQNGPINENGINGLTQEVLLAIVADRLRSFQSGPFACRENALAMTKIEEAQHWLHSRTLARMHRGVEGTHTK